MFGWRYHGCTTGEDRPGRTYREIAFSVERLDNVVWVQVSLWRWAFHWRKLDALRETGPKDNRAVLGWFFRGADRRRKGRAYRDAFNQPVPPFSPLSATEIRERNRKAVESGRFKPWGSVGKLDPHFER